MRKRIVSCTMVILFFLCLSNIVLAQTPDISGVYNGILVIAHISDNFYKIETSPNVHYPWNGCGIYWNGKILGIGKFMNSGKSFFLHMDVLDKSIVSRMVYLTDDQGNLRQLSSDIRVDQHIAKKSDFLSTPITNTIYKYGTGPNARYPWNGCGLYWNEKILGVGKFESGKSFMTHVEILGEKAVLRMVYLTDDQGNLRQLPSDIRVDQHATSK